MTRYRKLPGARRGLINSSSVWLGEDHLLLVKSSRFREEYKRFHLRDIQAIVVARAPRFHISTRALLIAVVWVVVFRIAVLMQPFPRIERGLMIEGFSFSPFLWAFFALLVVVWIYVSSAWSCRCRIYTAVSSDDLPSIYRTWTARKFLDAVEPKIAEVQGVLEGGWAEAVESRDIGPPLASRVAAQREISAAEMPSIMAAPPQTTDVASIPTHTLAADLLVGVLFLEGLIAFLTLKAPAASMRWASIAFMLIKLALAIAIFVQHYKGKLRTGMQNIAIAMLLAMGGVYYVQQMVASLQAGAAAARENRQVVPQVLPAFPANNHLVTEINGGASVLLGCVGLGIILLSKDSLAA